MVSCWGQQSCAFAYKGKGSFEPVDDSFWAQGARTHLGGWVPQTVLAPVTS